MTYAEWIADYVERQLKLVTVIGAVTDDERRQAVIRGRCSSAVEAMIQAFQELRRVRGHYIIAYGDGVHRCPHWWCETPDGTVVDPTKEQFDYQQGRYEEYTGPDPLGKCMWCGEYVWENAGWGGAACSEDCGQSLEAEYR